jgi:LacI family transcriptional regulator, galactose operon repressor
MKATIRDIAKKAGVTTATVSYVLNRKPNSRISEKTKEKVLHAAQSLQYSPHMHARSLATGRSFTIATHLIGPLDAALHDPYAIDVLRGVIKKASLSDYAVQVAVEDQTPKHRGVDGWICLSARQPLPDQTLQDCPVLYLDPVRDFGSNCYWAQNRAAGELLADKTAPHHSRVLFLAHERLEESPIAYRKRYEAFHESFSSQHGPQSVLLDHLHPDSPAEEYRRFAEKWIIKLRQSKTRVIICVSDMLASKIQQLLLSSGLRIPDDLGIVGFDNTTHSQMAIPAITTVDMQAEQMGLAAVQCLIERVEGRAASMLAPPPRWISRASYPVE